LPTLRNATRLVAAGGLVALAVVVVGAASSSGAGAGVRPGKALTTRCLRAVFGIGLPGAKPVAGSADPHVLSQFAVFRRPQSATDALPAIAHLGQALASDGATTYDPSRAVVLMHTSGHGAVYAVPSTVALPTLPAGCSGLPHFAGANAYLAMKALEIGSGAGVCLFSTRLIQSLSSRPPLPGITPPRPKKILVAGARMCESDALLSGYIGALGGALDPPRPRIALVPDGVASITYTRASGRTFTVPVAGNLATLPASLSSQTVAPYKNAGQFSRQLAAYFPTEVSESGPNAYPIASLPRPTALIPDIVAGVSFARHLLLTSIVSGGSGSGDESVSCSARTHRCVAVTISTSCNSHDRCRISRTIQRYRYQGRNPPQGTSGPVGPLIAPIVAHTSRFFNRPKKLTLVLTGASPARVNVILTVNCVGRNGGNGTGGGPTLQRAVPSRTPIALPGAARFFNACDVAALVTSTHHVSVHVTIERG
jgi:hypothetical protein